MSPKLSMFSSLNLVMQFAHLVSKLLHLAVDSVQISFHSFYGNVERYQILSWEQIRPGVFLTLVGGYINIVSECSDSFFVDFLRNGIFFEVST